MLTLKSVQIKTNDIAKIQNSQENLEIQTFFIHYFRTKKITVLFHDFQDFQDLWPPWKKLFCLHEVGLLKSLLKSFKSGALGTITNTSEPRRLLIPFVWYWHPNKFAQIIFLQHFFFNSIPKYTLVSALINITRSMIN